jgi:S1-C subfamily serine protease
MPEITGHEPDRARVAQVRVEHDHGDRHGSGYRVSDIVVLTAARVVEGASSVEVVFNADRSDRWSTTANVALCEPTADVAILELDWADGLEPVAPANSATSTACAQRSRVAPSVLL